MLRFIKNILKISAVAIIVPGVVFGAQQANPRSAVNNARNVARSADSESNAAVRRSATSVIARSTVSDKRKSRTVVTARPATVRGATVRSVRPVVKGATVARTASKPSVVRSAAKVKNGNGGVNVSRAGSARATAVFNDVSKIGGGYSSCRDAYATCMDQICANANDTYRRCFCSDRFTEFRDTSDRLDEALKLLAEFQNVNLDAVNKTAAEVDAMYSATEGEAAIKRDTSASQKLLDSISEVLSTKSKKSSTGSAKKNSTSMSSLGVLDLSSFATTSNDPFSDSTSAFGGGSSSYTDISALEGADLYEGAMQQCSQITRESCGGDAMFNLARSSYSILITQDCNAYEKNINAKKASVEETVRKAEKYLREARLEEYRAHNSADMNECLTAVDNAMRQQFACGPNLELCLDFTGLYISSTGEPVYSPALFDLNNVIVLSGSQDVLTVPQNAQYLQEFEYRKKSVAESALDSCRGIADAVWEEYKRMLLIQVAQAQDEKIQEVKNSCVEKIKECYDSKTGTLNSLAEDVSGSATKAISAIAARDDCKNEVFACAALYGDPNGCVYDDSTKKISTAPNKKCGMQSLLALVDTVDTVKFEKGCEEALREYVKEECAPESGDTEHKYPWGCRSRSPQWLEEQLRNRAATLCASDFGSDYNMNDTVNSKNGRAAAIKNVAVKLQSQNLKDTISSVSLQKIESSDATTNRKYGGNLELDDKVKSLISDIKDEISTDMHEILGNECHNISNEGNLIWDVSGFTVPDDDTFVSVSPTWLNKIYSGNLDDLIKTGVSGYDLTVGSSKTVRAVPGDKSFGWGICMTPSVYQFCSAQNQVPGMKNTAEYDKENAVCNLSSDWFRKKCSLIGGYFENDSCFIK